MLSYDLASLSALRARASARSVFFWGASEGGRGARWRGGRTGGRCERQERGPGWQHPGRAVRGEDEVRTEGMVQETRAVGKVDLRGVM